MLSQRERKENQPQGGMSLGIWPSNAENFTHEDLETRQERKMRKPLRRRTQGKIRLWECGRFCCIPKYPRMFPKGVSTPRLSVISVSKTYLWSGDLFDCNGIVHHWVGGKMFVHKVFKNHNSHVGIVQLVKKNRVLSTLVVFKRFI